MKNNVYKIIIILLIIAIALVISILVKEHKEESDYELVRIHIRAHSNSASDQALKHSVREKVSSFLTPLMNHADKKEQALMLLQSNLDNVQLIADETLRENRVPYQTTVTLDKEYFPSRRYEDIVFDEGIYDALIITLGEGQGDNWWCVAFPPLCFSPQRDEKIRYKSKIMEIIKKRRSIKSEDE